ncbi:MAG: hypothetical protein GY822_30350, partial [Deltaproteobacteria bacterium]|nr:hypothetical protein [Deltaproteobacteria bacterium]
ITEHTLAHQTTHICRIIEADSSVLPTNTSPPMSSNSIPSFDDADLVLLLAAVTAVEGRHSAIANANKDLLDAFKREEHNRRRRKGTPACEGAYVHRDVFPSWGDICSDPSHKSLFRKKYRMSESQFALLCAKINDVVGPGEFRPAQQNEGKKLISGEVRVAVGLRMLCGGSYMDYVGRIYGLRSVYSVYLCLEKLIEWLNKTFEFPLVTLLKEFEKGTVEATKKLSEMSDDFASESNGFFGGCIGALDG